ncbi:hypothetical protein EMIHUDRAFT_435414 [Emiliania huxleyi CCMP1516]|uniref:Uncharacterized protein n=2 Tax=Emiliania huxleyi TaxID=2903 RepID=A0A0D3JM96_EMIH1|nr:hypothetical protein EMIHUDRAFT_435414 [Emiliania huxleyi CCMP1516]EOD24631.1 hypothetical protein EMIHUDRAFT_435414 [Emiliania huxleyi CCMP1516]|eukprot:XP_005777060.1 hypothetical protein EMIHUDRAFT_435414 [Emiliania huxleyi CCMP1516]
MPVAAALWATPTRERTQTTSTVIFPPKPRCTPTSHLSTTIFPPFVSRLCVQDHCARAATATDGRLRGGDPLHRAISASHRGVWPPRSSHSPPPLPPPSRSFPPPPPLPGIAGAPARDCHRTSVCCLE